MSTILGEMQPSLFRYCDIISQVVKVAIAVVDCEYTYLAYKGGKWRKNIGVKLINGNIVKAALTTGTPQVMLETHNHPACLSCNKRNTCKEVLEMWVPIIVSEQIVGVIGLVCETQQQQTKVKKDSKKYLHFLSQISNLIAFEATNLLEAKNKESLISLLEKIINHFDSGVLVLNSFGDITHLSKLAKQILYEFQPEIEESKIEIETTNEKVGNLSLFNIICNNFQLPVCGTIYHIGIEQYDTVLIFNKAEVFRRLYKQGSALDQISGISKEISKTKENILTASKSPSNVLSCAEEGVDIELYARAVHDESDRYEKPFISIDCSTLPDSGVEEYLFGRSASSNLPGSRGKPGIIEAALGGTIYFKNISAIPANIQTAMVNLFERKEIKRCGSNKYRRLNIRIISSTSLNLKKVCEDGNFNKGLYYLSSILPITIPPLREREGDIIFLAREYIKNYAKYLNKQIDIIDDDFWTCIENYSWPGNTRELRSTMEYVVNNLDHSKIVCSNLLPDRVNSFVRQEDSQHLSFNLEEAERHIIAKAIHILGNQGMSKEQIAENLGIGVASLYRKIKKYGL